MYIYEYVLYLLLQRNNGQYHIISPAELYSSDATWDKP